MKWGQKKKCQGYITQIYNNNFDKRKKNIDDWGHEQRIVDYGEIDSGK